MVGACTELEMGHRSQDPWSVSRVSTAPLHPTCLFRDRFGEDLARARTAGRLQ